MMREILDMEPATFNVQRARLHGEQFYVYSGPSMNPTLDESDMLEVHRYDDKAPRVGDVILFSPLGRDQAVVHRIAKITPLGIYTRGDNNELDDSWVLQPVEILGRVEAAQRWNRRRRVAGGLAGVLYGQLAGFRRIINRTFSLLLHPAYCRLAESGFIYRLAPPSLRPRMVAFGNGDQRRMRQMIGRRFVVGRYDAQHQIWRIRRPFRLILPPDFLKKSTR
jgi:signal peptidase I